MRANDERLAALRAQDDQLARAALRSVVDDLSLLLDSATRQVMQSGGQHTRKQVKKLAKKNLATATAAELPLAELADLLNVPREQVEIALQSLRTDGGMDLASREAALRQIRQLRAQLQLVVAKDDHSLLDKLVKFIVKIAQALAIAAAAAAAGTLAVGGKSIPFEVVRALIIALITVALKDAAAAIDQHRATSDSHETARETLADVTAELASFTSAAGTRSAYELERSILRIRLLVKTFKAQQALLEVEWDGKPICCEILSGLVTQTSSDELELALRKLRTVQNPALPSLAAGRRNGIHDESGRSPWKHASTSTTQRSCRGSRSA